MKNLSRIEIISGVIWASTILVVAAFLLSDVLKDYIWLVLNTAAGVHITYLSSALKKMSNNHTTKAKYNC